MVKNEAVGGQEGLNITRNNLPPRLNYSQKWRNKRNLIFFTFNSVNPVLLELETGQTGL